MPSKIQLIYLKEARKLAKLRKIKAKSKTLVKNTFFLFENKSTKNL